MGFAVRPIALLVIALVPAAYQLWAGRDLARMADDPALPERLLAFRGRRRTVTAFTIGLLIWVARGTFWPWPLLAAAIVAAAYPLRRVLYRETWSLGTYCWAVVRFFVAMFGFWGLLAATPAMVLASPTRGAAIVAALAVALGLWHVGSYAVLRRLLRTRPLTDPEVLQSFRQMVDACGLAGRVDLEVVPLHGGSLANAAALPSASPPSRVVVTETLLERFDRDEVRAILAHELAHVEYYTPRRLYRLNAWSAGLVVVTLACVPLARLVAPDLAFGVAAIWPLVVVAVMAATQLRRQQHETDSDLRAVSLGGDAAALIRALEKLHAFNLVPRRWTTEFEQQATHPSLARRVRDITAMAGTPAVALEAPVSFGAAGDAGVTFRTDRLEWRDADGTSHAFTYPGLTELRLVPGAAGSGTLVATDAATRRWSLPIAAADVALMQRTLDRVDTRLGRGPVGAPGSAAFLQLMASLVVLTAIASGAMSVVVAGAAGLFRAAPSLTAAAGAAAVTAGALRAWWPAQGSPSAWFGPALIAAGVLTLAVAIHGRRTPPARHSGRVLGVLAALAAICWLSVWIDGPDLVTTRAHAVAWPAATVLPAAAAAGIALSAWQRRRAWVAVFGLAVVVTIVASMPSVAERLAGDPFVVAAPVLEIAEDAGPMTAERRLESGHDVALLYVSPEGTALAVGHDRERGAATVSAGPVRGAFTTFDANEARFVDERRLLLSTSSGNGVTLRVVDLQDGGRELWRREVPVFASSVEVEVPSGRWQVFGADANDVPASASGALDASETVVLRWPALASNDASVHLFAVNGPAVLALETTYHGPSPAVRWLPGPLPFLWGRSMATVRRLESAAPVSWTSTLAATCVAGRGGIEAYCAADDGYETRLFTMAGAGAPRALAKVVGTLRLDRAADATLLEGSLDDRPVLVDLAALRVRRPGRDGRHEPFLVAASRGAVAIATFDTDATVLTVYPRSPGRF